MKSERIRKLLWRLDNFADELMLQGKYYKKTARELKIEAKKQGLL